MPSFIRLVFVVLLVLLQLVAPLIHAHKNDKCSDGTSFHLPEFEQVNALLEQGSNMLAPSFHEGEIITVTAGVKENQRRFLFIDSPTVFIGFCLLIVCMLQHIAQRFFVQTEPIKRSLFFNQALPRAPPFFTV